MSESCLPAYRNCHSFKCKLCYIKKPPEVYFKQWSDFQMKKRCSPPSFLLLHVSLLVRDWSLFIQRFDLWKNKKQMQLCNLYQRSQFVSIFWKYVMTSCHQNSFLSYHCPTIVLFTSIFVFCLPLTSVLATAITTLTSIVLTWDQNSH